MARSALNFHVIVTVALALLSSSVATVLPSIHHGKRATVPLRIMPLGDSITKGALSSTGNGYRGPLQRLLLASGGKAGEDVDFTGSLRNGNMNDPDNEGHSGKFLSDILSYVGLSINANPNVVLIHAGTNDMDLDVDVANAPARLEKIIRAVVAGSPGVTVLVAQIIFCTDPDEQANNDAYNARIPQIVADLRSEDSSKFKVLAVDMSDILTRSDLADKKHPNDQGYAKMAQAWKNGIDEVLSRGWVTTPKSPAQKSGVGHGLSGSGSTSNSHSGKCGSSNWNAVGTIATTISNYAAVGLVATGVKNATDENVLFADVNGDGRDDYLVVLENGAVFAYTNNGKIPTGTGTKWTNIGLLAAGVGAKGSQVQFADVDGDKLADYIVANDDGSVDWWRNTGNLGKDKSRLNFEAKRRFFDGYNKFGGRVIVQDFDGDGRADPLILYDGGAVRAWKNTRDGIEAIGEVAPGISGVSGSHVHLKDYDGDGKADYLVLWQGGAVEAYLNEFGEGPERTWTDIGVIASGIKGVSGSSVRFADLNGDNVLDYLSISATGQVQAWVHNGDPRKGDGVRFADLNGDGMDDLLWISKAGEVHAWLNTGLESSSWSSIGVIAKLAGVTRDKIHFADVDGDRAADFLVVYDGGAVTGYRNNGALGKATPSFDNIGTIASGVGAPGSQVRFADINGDGFADYIVVNDDSSADAYLNLHNILNDQRNFEKLDKTFAAGISGVSGEKIVFADLDGDRWDDYIVSWAGGAVHAYKNSHNLGASSSHRNWIDVGAVAAGVKNQGTVHIADVSGDGRADYLSVDPWSGVISAYINICAGDLLGSDIPKGEGDDYPTTDDATNDDQWADEDPTFCDFSKHYDDLASLAADAKSDLREDCVAYYTLDTLIRMLDTAYRNYTDVNTGYDDLFDYYVTYIEKMVPWVLKNQFMFNISDPRTTSSPRSAYGMAYFDCSNDGKEFPCIDWNSEQGVVNGDFLWEHTTDMTLFDTTGYPEGLIKAGLQPDWVALGDAEVDVTLSEVRASRTFRYKFTGFPIGAPDMKVPNPKDIVTDSLKNFPELRTSMEATLYDIMLGNWIGGSVQDPSQVYSVPVFLLIQGIEGMAQAKMVGEQEKEEEEKEAAEKRKNLILLIISVVFLFVPFFGEAAASAAGLATLARTLAIVGELGNAALAVYDTYQDPSSVLLNVLGSLVGVGSIAKAARSGKGFAPVAAKRTAGLKGDLVGQLGDLFKRNDDDLQSILKVCRR